MITVVNCITTEHNLLLVLLAALMCIAGIAVTFRLHCRACSAVGSQKFGWTFLTAVCAGSATWSTHFIAMLGYRPDVPATFEPVLTIISLLVAIVGSAAGLLLASSNHHRSLRALGGAVVGLAFIVMHYMGTFAYRVEGLVEWNQSLVVASILLCITLSVAAFDVLRSYPCRYSRWAAVVLLVSAVVSLHFTSMAAFRVIVLDFDGVAHSNDAIVAMAISIAVATLIIVGVGFASYLIDDFSHQETDEHIRHLALHDSLTGLSNRTSFNAQVDKLIAAARQRGLSVSVIGMDLDRFKEINDGWGHSTGDATLREFANRLQAACLAGEYVARVGGDEFAAVKLYKDDAELDQFLSEIGRQLRNPVCIGGLQAKISASIGVAMFPRDASKRDVLINNADLAMYEAKAGGEGRIRFYEPRLGERVRTRRALAEDLRFAIENRQLSIHYQVQTSIKTGNTTGYEALLRWRHPQHGNVSPSEFIPLAEESGLILQLGEWVLRQACLEAATWEPACKVAVNISAVQFGSGDFARTVHEVLLQTGLSASRLELELTETALVRDKLRSLHLVRQIKSLGVRIALDDFGTGYSSLDTLRSFPFDKIKLDRSFIEGLSQEGPSLAIVHAVIALGKSLGVPVLAEGVETPEQLALLSSEDCDEAQGYLLGRPKPVTEIATSTALNTRIFTPPPAPREITAAVEEMPVARQA